MLIKLALELLILLITSSYNRLAAAEVTALSQRLQLVRVSVPAQQTEIMLRV